MKKFTFKIQGKLKLDQPTIIFSHYKQGEKDKDKDESGATELTNVTMSLGAGKFVGELVV